MQRAASKSRRVVISGLGLVNPLADAPPAFWRALTERQSGVRPLTALPTASLPCSFAAEVRDFSGAIDDFGPLEKAKKKAIRKSSKLMCRETLLGVAAAERAVQDARFSDAPFDHERTGVIFGCDYLLTRPDDFSAGIVQCGGLNGEFEFDRWGDEGLGQMSPLWLLKYLPNMPASHVAIFNDLRGPNNSITHREAAGNLAIGEAFHMIRRGHADRILAGATGSRIHPYKTLHALGQSEVAGGDGPPEKASRPFDKNRSGMVLGEGAGVVVLEELETAEARGATIYAEICGRGSGFSANRTLHGDAERALATAMLAALKDADASPDVVGHIHAHGLSATEGDAEEARAIGHVFGPRAGDVPVVAAKSNFGNLGAGSSVVELIASVLALCEGRLFPTLNYETPDPECPINVVTDGDTPSGNSFLNLNVTPQGQAGVLFVRRWV